MGQRPMGVSQVESRKQIMQPKAEDCGRGTGPKPVTWAGGQAEGQGSDVVANGRGPGAVAGVGCWGPGPGAWTGGRSPRGRGQWPGPGARAKSGAGTGAGAYGRCLGAEAKALFLWPGKRI